MNKRIFTEDELRDLIVENQITDEDIQQILNNQTIIEKIDNYVNHHSWTESILEYHAEGNFAKFHNQLQLILKDTEHSGSKKGEDE